MLKLFKLKTEKYIKDIILGANDGIITTFAVVAGVAGASLSINVILILGIANLFADGISMGASSYLGSKSEHIVKNKNNSHKSDTTPIKSGFINFTAFVIAGSIPLIPYFLGLDSFALSIIFTVIAFALLGSARTFITDEKWYIGMLEIVLIGSVAAFVSYLIGFFLKFLLS